MRVVLAETGDIAPDQEGLAAGVGDVLGDRFGRVDARIVVQRDPGALRREGSGKRRADAGRSAGDQHGLAGKVGDRRGGWSLPWASDLVS